MSLESDKEIYDIGDAAVLTCTHQGGPGNIIQWLRNGSLLQEAENTVVIETLVIGEVLTCIVTNPAGESRDDIILNILPIISSQPSSIFAIVNQIVEICCSISSYPPPFYQWFKVNSSLPANTQTSESSCLIVNEVSFGDEGEYYCVGTSHNVSVTSLTALLTSESLCIRLIVDPQYNIIDIHITVSPYGSVRVSPHNAVFNNGDSVNLTCLAEGGPGNTFQWTFNGTAIDTHNDYLVLLINATENGGYYTCTATNAAGSASDSTAVYVYPTITVQPTDTFVTPSTSGVLMCEASAFPYPDYAWEHVEHLYTPFASGWNTSMLPFNIADYIVGSEGDYYCKATSNGMTVESERATVFGKSLLFCNYKSIFPSCPVSPLNVFINTTMLEYAYEEGDTVYLTCIHSGGPNNTYSWWINGGQLNKTSPTLIHTISHADEDGGFYSCIVSNPAGQSSHGIDIYTFPTVFVAPVDTNSLVGGVAMFTCAARGFPTPSYVWSKTDGNLPNTSIILTLEGGLSRLVIQPVELEDHGEYNCIASGRGSVRYSAVLSGMWILYKYLCV